MGNIKFCICCKQEKDINEFNKDKNNKDGLASQRRKEIMEQLPYTFTEEEWQQCLEYFDYSCAYCGSKKNIQQDHFVSIMNDGPYTKNNMVVACGFCNPSKSDSNFFEWYPKQKSIVKSEKRGF